MIKLEIHILDGQLDIEIKKEGDGYNLLVILSKTVYYKEKGRAWNGRTTNDETVEEIARLIKECYEKPSVPKYITIADGMQVNINLKEEKSEIQFSILNNFDEGTNEFQFMQNTFDLINEIIPDDALKRYSGVFWGWTS
ncbi:MAG: hypothetical protein ACO1N0_14220 [Fluviicola sp.]